MFAPLFFTATLLGALATADYTVVQRSVLGGSGGWDYLEVDPDAHRLYIARSDRVLVFDTQTSKLVATISGLDGAHGIALATNADRGFATSGRANRVTEFALSTAKPVREIAIEGETPDALIYESHTQRVFVFNGRSHNASVLDLEGKLLATIGLPGKPEFAVVDEHGGVFVNIEDTAQLVRIDAASVRTTATWKLKECTEPTGLALDTRHRRLFSVCQNERMSVTDAADGHHVASVPIGKGPDGVVFDRERSLIFSANGESGTLTVVHQDDADRYSVVANVPTQVSARTLALDPKTHRIYTVAAEFRPAPPPTAAEPHPRRSAVEGTFTLLVVGEK